MAGFEDTGSKHEEEKSKTKANSREEIKKMRTRLEMQVTATALVYHKKAPGSSPTLPKTEAN